MADREKVIKGLECCKRKDGNECKVCPYTESECCVEDMVTDALTLLKEQEEEISRISNKYLDIVKVASKQPQIVRCKDCKHGGCRTTYTDGRIAKVVCKLHGTKKNEVWMNADWFCADGEREE